VNDVKVAVIYYSATGGVFALAEAAAKAAEVAGAQVRLRKVRELAPAEAIASNESWGAHAAATQKIAEATGDTELAAVGFQATRAVTIGTALRKGLAA